MKKLALAALAVGIAIGGIVTTTDSADAQRRRGGSGFHDQALTPEAQAQKARSRRQNPDKARTGKGNVSPSRPM